MFQHILVPLDGSILAEGVLPHISLLAKAGAGRVTLLHVLDPQAQTVRSAMVDPFEWQIRKAEAETYLRTMANRLEEAAFRPEVEIMEGRAAESVIRFASDHQVDLIALSSHGQSGISSWNVSSVVQKIVLRARRSILIVRAYQAPLDSDEGLHYQRIVVPLDGSQRAEVALAAASELARANDAELRVIHIVERPEIPHRTPLSQEDQDLIDRMTERKRVEAMKYLSELKVYQDLKLETSVLESENVITALHQAVEDVQADMVVCSAHGYTGTTRWPYGSVAVSFIIYGSAPLLIVQDLPENRIELTSAELAARERGGR